MTSTTQSRGGSRTEGSETQLDSPGPRSDKLHVSPDGSEDNSGTEAEPISSIQTAIERAGPGQTVYAHPGEYREYVEFHAAGEPDAPITLTGPPDAVLKPPEDIDHQGISVGASHIHITGLTISGLYDPDNPDDPNSYHAGKLVDLNSFAEDDDDYIEGLVVSPHGIGGAGGALINSVRIKNCEIGGFKVIGPAGTNWILDDTPGHYGEVVYLGTAAGNVAKRDGFDEYDRTRNIRVHHIDNSAGHPHAELVDCKTGVENVTIEYCTDGGGAQTHEGPHQRSISLDGHGCTVRWNVIQNVVGDGVKIGPQGFLSNPGTLGEPQTDLERQMGKDNAVYGNVFTGNTHDAINFYRESQHPGRESNPLPEDQRSLCGNLFDGYSDDTPGKSCPMDLPSGNGVGHLGGDSPWDGEAPTKAEVFERDALAQNLETTVEGDSVPTGTEFKATVTITNTGASSEEVVIRLRVGDSVLGTETVTVPAGETRTVQLSDDLPDPEEVAITRNGQKIGYVRVKDD